MARACRRTAPPGFRAAPRADFAVTAIRLQSLTPSRLRCCALRLPPGESPTGYPRRAQLGTPRCRRTGYAGSARATPRLDGRDAGLRPGLLRQVAPKRAALDAGGSAQPRHEGRFTDTPPGHAYGASTPRRKHVAASKGRGRSRLSLACWPCPRQGAGRCSRHAGMPRRPSLPSGQGGPCVLVSL